MVRTFLPRATQSELFAIMTGGFASIAGSFTGILIGMGIEMYVAACACN